jgi:hypothetical protein
VTSAQAWANPSGPQPKLGRFTRYPWVVNTTTSIGSLCVLPSASQQAVTPRPALGQRRRVEGALLVRDQDRRRRCAPFAA